MADTFARETIETRLVDVFSRYKQGKVDVQLASVITADLGVDSLAVMEIVADLEDSFELTFPDEELPTIKTVADVANLIVLGLEKDGRLTA